MKREVWASPLLRDELLRQQKWRKWTQGQMAGALGISRETYCDFIAGKRALRHEALCHAYELGISAAVILAPPPRPASTSAKSSRFANSEDSKKVNPASD